MKIQSGHQISSQCCVIISSASKMFWSSPKEPLYSLRYDSPLYLSPSPWQPLIHFLTDEFIYSEYFKEMESSNMSLTLVLASVPSPTRNEGLDKSSPDSAILIWLHPRTYQVCITQLFSVHGSSLKPHPHPPRWSPALWILNCLFQPLVPHNSFLTGGIKDCWGTQ